MKQRITFLRPLGTGINPKSISIDETKLSFAAVHGDSVEKRITWSLDELPIELSALLQQSHELHLRWSQEASYEHLQPLSSKLPPGLHLHFTPRTVKQDVQLCQLLLKIFGYSLSCSTIYESFSTPSILSERFASTAKHQYHQLLPDLQHFVEYVEQNVCQPISDTDRRSLCEVHARSLRDAASFDIDYDAISHALTLAAVWVIPSKPEVGTINHRLVEQVGVDDRVEVGVLAPEVAEEPEELKLGGYLTTLGENKKPGATLFSFPSRHHALARDDLTSFNASFTQPTGLHPVLEIAFPRSLLKAPQQSCALHTYLTLPSALFVDRYQLSDPALLASSNLRALHALSGAEDLEAPDWAASQWGSASLFELAVPYDTNAINSSSETWDVQIPLHLRYLQTNTERASSYRAVRAPWPIAFWACRAEEGLKMATNPFDRVNQGYDGLFGQKTMFYHIPPAQQNLVLDLDVPVLHPTHGTWLQSATLVIVVLGFGYVLGSLILPLGRKTQDVVHAKKE